jgi:hypothetical protein
MQTIWSIQRTGWTTVKSAMLSPREEKTVKEAHVPFPILEF